MQLEPQVWVPFVLAVATGLAVLAYRHRPFFEWMAGGILVLTVTAMILTAVWNTAIARVWIDLSDVVPPEHFDDGLRIMNEAEVLVRVVLLAAAATLALLFFLRLMPKRDDDTRSRGDT